MGYLIIKNGPQQDAQEGCEGTQLFPVVLKKKKWHHFVTRLQRFQLGADINWKLSAFPSLDSSNEQTLEEQVNVVMKA